MKCLYVCLLEDFSRLFCTFSRADEPHPPRAGSENKLHQVYLNLHIMMCLTVSIWYKFTFVQVELQLSTLLKISMKFGFYWGVLESHDGTLSQRGFPPWEEWISGENWIFVILVKFDDNNLSTKYQLSAALMKKYQHVQQLSHICKIPLPRSSPSPHTHTHHHGQS